MNQAERDKQIAEAEEILGDSVDEIGFAKSLYFGQYAQDKLPSYPASLDDATVRLAARLRQFCQEQIDPVAIDRDAEIPAHVIQGLADLGILGACLPKSCGGLELSQQQYCQLLEVLGGHCASTALFVNAHHSIGPRALVLFGTKEQQEKYLPQMASGEWISAFALTEPEAGSDAANVQTRAEPREDGSGFVLNGEKRWITNGGIAQALTVMARTPVPGKDETKITAFLVTPDMPGFEVVEKRMEKCGVRGTVTSRLAFHDMFVPRENVLGPLGKGLRVALTVLDFGRTTFGASCTGAAKRCVQDSLQHARSRVQFGKRLGDFEMVKEKLAWMQAHTYAMEACTYETAALIDGGDGDFMLETAMLKVFSTEALWRIVYDTFQIYGGSAYFTDQPFERMMRDARINQIGEGANDVLRSFVALVGMRDVGLELEGVLNAIRRPVGNLGRLGKFASRKMGSLLSSPNIELRNAELEPDAARVSRDIGALGGQVEKLLRTYQLDILDMQYLQGRVADAAIDLYVCACVLNRLDQSLTYREQLDGNLNVHLDSGRHFLALAHRRIRQNLKALWNHEDQATTRLADQMLARDPV